VNYKNADQKLKRTKHSASVCWHGGCKYLAFYDCEGEGWTQTVRVLKQDSLGVWKQVLCTAEGAGGGNPVIFEYCGRLYLAMTKFRHELKGVTHVGKLWANTDLLMYNIVESERSMKLVMHYPYLGVRCAPTVCDGYLFLPCYDESRGEGVVLQFNRNMLWTRNGIIAKSGCRIIQPSLIANQKGSRIKIDFLCRNFTPRFQRTQNQAFQGSYTEPGRILVQHSKIPNYNESVCIFNSDTHNYVMYGELEGRTHFMIRRRQIGETEWERVHKLNADHAKGCYPNYCWNPDGSMTVVFTVYDGPLSGETKIAMVQFDQSLKELDRDYIG